MDKEHNRVELDPPSSTQPVNEQAAPPEKPEVRRADDGEVQDRVIELLDDPQLRRRMGEAARLQARPDAAPRIVDRIVDIVGAPTAPAAPAGGAGP